MRLADQIIAAGRDRRHPLHADYERLADAVATAERFEVSPEAGALAAAIGKSDGSRLREARPFARAPYRSTWLEWVGSSGGFYGHDLEPLAPGQMAPSRTGFLVETDESHLRGAISQVWSARAPNGKVHLEVSPLCMTYDWSEAPLPVPTLARRAPGQALFPLGPRNPREARVLSQMRSLTQDQVDEDLSRHGHILNPRLSAFHEMFSAEMLRDPVGAAQRASTVIDDWNGELNFIFSFLISLNSRNLLRVEAGEDLAKLNKARRRLGRPEFLSFATVQLSLSQVMRRKEMAASGGGDIRAHLVRGHFKLRKTGAFWWSPFVRGDARKGVVVRRGYEVAA